MDFLLSEYVNKFFPEYITDEKVWAVIRQHDCSVFNSCDTAVAIYRMQRSILNVEDVGTSLRLLSLLQKQLCGCELYYTANIGENFLLVHGLGTVIGSGVNIGNNVTLYHNVTLGTKYDSEKNKCVVEDDVIVYAGAKILGGITIGKGAVIGANSVVLMDVGEREVYAGVPAKCIGKVTDSKYKLPVGVK